MPAMIGILNENRGLDHGFYNFSCSVLRGIKFMRVRSLTAAFVLVFMASGPRAAKMEVPSVKASGAHLTVLLKMLAGVTLKISEKPSILI
jgi:hypothetical protein